MYLAGVGTNVTAVDLKDTGHWLTEERPEETMEALIAFL
jgi:pimeloyl-ACP methyl ester carboxylesterase